MHTFQDRGSNKKGEQQQPFITAIQQQKERDKRREQAWKRISSCPYLKGTYMLVLQSSLCSNFIPAICNHRNFVANERRVLI